MPLVNWLKQIHALASRPLSCQGGQWGIRGARRHARRNRQHGFSSSAVIQSEPLEDRVLLTTTDGIDLNLGAYSPVNPYSSNMNNTSGTYSQVSNNQLNTSNLTTSLNNSPMGQNMGSTSTQLQTYLTSAQSSGTESFQQAMNSQNNASTTSLNSSGTGGTSPTTGTGSTNTTGTGGTGTGGDGSGSDNNSNQDDNDDVSNESTESLFPAWKPFQLPTGVEFPQTTLPAQSFQQNLFAVQPEGTGTFTNTVTTISSVGSSTVDGTDGGDPEDDDADIIPLTDLTTTVTSEQTYNSSNDWIVRQSVTNRFDQNSDPDTATTTDGASSPTADTDNVSNGRTGTKTFSITVINGTTTITSFRMSDSFTFSSGSIPGEAESDDPYAIPDDWIQNAIKSVNSTTAPTGATTDNAVDTGTGDNGSNDEDDEDDEDSASGIAALANGSGVFIAASYSVSADVTQSLITLADGSMAMTYTLVIGFSASFSTRAGGHFSIDQSDLDADTLAELDGLAISASTDFNFFATGSVAGRFTATATLPLNPLSADFANADFAASFQFGTSFNTGGSSSSLVRATKNVSSGSVSDGNDVYDRVNIKHKSTSAGYFGASLWLGASTESDDADESDGSVDDNTEDEGDTTGGGDEEPGPAGSDSESDETPPLAGSQSATDLIDSDKTGLQFSLAVSGSTSTKDKAVFATKTRWSGSGPRHGYESWLDSEASSNTTDSHFNLELGTEQMLVDFGISGGDSKDVEVERTVWAFTQYDTLQYHPLWTDASYSETSESHYRFGLVLGGDDPGLTSSGGYSVDIAASEAAHGHWLNGAHSYHIEIETIHDHGGDVESATPKRHRITEQYIGTYDDRLIVVKDVAIIAPPNQNQQSLTDILADYRVSEERRAGLQADLDNTTNPRMQRFLQDQLDIEASTQSTTSQKALAAGATQQQLDEIDNNTGDISDSQSDGSVNNDDSATVDPDRINVTPTIGIYSDGTHAWVQFAITVAVPPGHTGPPTPYLVKIEIYGPGSRKDAVVPALIGVPALATLSVKPGWTLPTNALHVRFENGDARSFHRIRTFVDRYTEKGFMKMLTEAINDNQLSKSDSLCTDAFRLYRIPDSSCATFAAYAAEMGFTNRKLFRKGISHPNELRHPWTMVDYASTLLPILEGPVWFFRRCF